MRAKRAISKLGDSSKQEILNKLLDSATADEIQDELGIDSETYELCFSQLLDHLAERANKLSVEHWYAEYWVDTMAILRRLKAETKAANSREAIAGLRAMADIRTSLLKEARNLGIVKPIGSDVDGPSVFVQFVQGLTSEQLRAELKKLADEFQAIDAELAASDLPSKTKKSLFSGDSVFDQGLQNG